MNILVTGANGQLGNEIRIIAKNSINNYIFTDVVESECHETTILDITKLDDVRSIVAKHEIDTIINCAAFTNVDRAEDDSDCAHKLNAEAPYNLSVAMTEVNGLLVHISTDYVFGGDPYNTPCGEEQHGTPTGVYGETKLEGERKVILSGCKHIIIRTSWLYSEFGKNFVKTMMNLTSSKPSLNVVFDQVGTPTYAYDLAEVIVSIVENGKCDGNYGIYHYSNEGVCSWYDFAVTIAKMCGNNQCAINPCHSNEFPSKVVRPSYSVLDKTKIKTTFGISIPHWTDSLSKCIKNIINQPFIN